MRYCKSFEKSITTCLKYRIHRGGKHKHQGKVNRLRLQFAYYDIRFGRHFWNNHIRFFRLPIGGNSRLIQYWQDLDCVLKSNKCHRQECLINTPRKGFLYHNCHRCCPNISTENNFRFLSPRLCAFPGLHFVSLEYPVVLLLFAAAVAAVQSIQPMCYKNKTPEFSATLEAWIIIYRHTSLRMVLVVGKTAFYA